MTGLRKLNNHVLSLIEESDGIDDIKQQWSDPANQRRIKTMCGPRKKKDPNAPKRGKSGYLFFCGENRETVKYDLGEGAKATEVMQELGRRWNELKDRGGPELEHYYKLADEDKARYEEEKKHYVEPDLGPDDFDDWGSPGRRAKKPAKTGPTRPKSAYIYFCSANRPAVKRDNPDMPATEVTAELAREWGELKRDPSRYHELAQFERMAAADKARYENAKECAASPTRHVASPTRRAASPTRRAASPTRHVASPTRRAASPTRRAASPTRRAASPVRHVASPTRRAASPVRHASIYDEEHPTIAPKRRPRAGRARGAAKY